MSTDPEHEKWLNSMVAKADRYAPNDTSADAEDDREFADAIKANREEKAAKARKGGRRG